MECVFMMSKCLLYVSSELSSGEDRSRLNHCIVEYYRQVQFLGFRIKSLMHLATRSIDLIKNSNEGNLVLIEINLIL